MLNFKMNEVTDGATGGSGGLPAANIADGGNPNGQGTTHQSLGGSGGGSGDGGTNGKSWLDTLPDDIKGDPSLAVFKDVSGLAKSFVNAQKMIGADKVIIPNEKSSEEEWNAFYQKMGRPESPDKYEIKAPNGQDLNPEIAKGFKEVAHQLGLSPKQVAKLADWNFGTIAAQQESHKTAQVNALRETISTYKQTLGGEEKYAARVDEARAALNAVATPELKEFLKTSGLGSRPEMIEFFANLKPMMDEGKFRDGTGIPMGIDDPAAIQAEIKSIEEKLFANLNSSSRGDWVEQRNKLYERLSAARKGA